MDDRPSMKQSLDGATRWVLHSGSMEHLCLYHLVRSRIAKRSGDFPGAERALDEGLHIARQCGFWLYHVELLCVRAELQLTGFRVSDAVRSAQEAFELATLSDCQFAWGAAEAGHLLGRALAARGRVAEARAALETTLAIRRRIGDFRAEQTEALLRSLPGREVGS
jgi:hypothetical protein